MGTYGSKRLSARRANLCVRQKERLTEFEASWLQDIHFSKELTDNITDNNDFAPNSVWMRSCQGMGVEKVHKDDTALTFEFLFRFNRVWINSRLLLRENMALKQTIHLW